MHKLLTALVLLVSLLVPSLASAQGNLGSHYRETTLSMPTGQGLVYLPIPRVGWPVNVLLSGTYTQTGSVFMLTSFVVSDGGAGNSMLTFPTVMANEGPVSCVPTADPDRILECYITTYFSVGVADSSSAQAHKFFVGVNVGTPLQLRITMWY